MFSLTGRTGAGFIAPEAGWGMAKKAIVLGISVDHAFAAGTVLASILAHDPDFAADVVIFHDGLAKDQQAAFLRLWPRCMFRTFSLASVSAQLRLDREDPRMGRFLARYSPLVMAKLDLPLLLETYAKVLWLDADILVRGSLGPLWDFDCLAWRPLPKGAFLRREKAISAFSDRRLDPGVPLLNGGVIGVARGFIERGGSAMVVHDLARLYLDRAPPFQFDEMPWYLVAASLALPVTRYPQGFNHPVVAAGAENAVVIHAIGAQKFWNTAALLDRFPDWALHQARWVACGGKPYAGKVTFAEGLAQP